MDMIVECRYNNHHRVKQSRLLIHEQKCPDRKGSKMVSCPYNPSHKVSFLKLDHHKKICPDKPQIEQSLKNEMEAYIQQMKKQRTEDNKKPNPISMYTQPSYQAQIKVPEPKVAEVLPVHNIREEDIFNLGDENGVVEYTDQEDDFDFDENDKENGVFDNVYE